MNDRERFEKWAEQYPNCRLAYDGNYCDHYWDPGIQKLWEAWQEARRCEPINIIFDGPPGPAAGRFIEVETDDYTSIRVGEWIERADGLWALRITSLPEPPDEQEDT